MPHPELDRFLIRMEPLAARPNKKQIENDCILPEARGNPLTAASAALLDEAIQRILVARQADRPVILAFGAHAIKNGLGPVFLRLLENGWVTHLATNGAGIIHDWEFSYQGQSCEHVGPRVAEGRFGHWQETGFYINLALNVGAYEGRGYGESVGAMIEQQGLMIPSVQQLRDEVRQRVEHDPAQAAAAADLCWIVERFELPEGWLEIPHPWRAYSIQAGAFRHRVPFTGHPMYGHDIIYNHPMNRGACLGRAAERDYLIFAESVRRLAGGVYISVGSAVMSPMIFEKAFSMAQNLAIQKGEHIDDHYLLVVDLAHCDWDWSQGEPPENNPAYYLRYNKTFSRMGGHMRYLSADNRDFLLALHEGLSKTARPQHP